MVSMKIEYGNGGPAEAPNNPYGYALCICLNEEQVEALGLSGNPPKAGATVGLRAIARVVSVTQDANPAAEAAEGENPAEVDVSLRLQITDLEITSGAAKTSAESASLLYSGDND